MKVLGWTIPGLLAVVLGASLLTGTQQSGPRVTHVVDGDTIEVAFDDGRVEKVRYIGVDTPEMDDKPQGDLAKLANKRLVDGKTITMKKDVSDRDQFGRLLRYVYVGKTFINAELVREGNARAKDYPPDTKHSKLLHRLESQAQKARVGLWAAQTDEADLTTAALIGNANSKKLHNPAHALCADSISKMSEKNKVPFDSPEDAQANGYNPCQLCKSN